MLDLKTLPIIKFEKGEVVSLPQASAIGMFQTLKTLNGICSKYGFEDVDELRRFNASVGRLFKLLDDQQRVFEHFCDSDEQRTKILTSLGRIKILDR